MIVQIAVIVIARESQQPFLAVLFLTPLFGIV
jgi:hypothetical protein